MANIRINLRKYQENLLKMIDFFDMHHKTMMVVTKVFCADEKLIEIINQTKVSYIADSRILNLANINTQKKKVLLRLPSMGEADAVITHTDVSLNSEIKTIQALNEQAKRQHKIHEIILMIDLGDLREGIYFEDFNMDMINEIIDLTHIKLIGIGTNLTCYGGVIPSTLIYENLIKIKHKLLEAGIHIGMVSGGNSSSLDLLEKGLIDNEINNFRIGEAIVLGRETAYGNHFKDLHEDCFILEASIIEHQYKYSYPQGELGRNAFGEKVRFHDVGKHHRYILDIGKQDIDISGIIFDESIEPLGISSDHLIFTSTKQYEVGDKLYLKLNYGGILSLMTSKYIGKIYETI